MKFNLLGPLEVVRNGVPLRLGGVNQRAALGFLLLHANTPVSTGRLISALWAWDEPPTARKILQNAVSGLRRMLSTGERPYGPSCSLTTSRGSYMLQVPSEHVDLSRHARLVKHGRQELADGLYEQAARTLRDALGLWRGEALADLIEVGVTWPELTPLREARWAALEGRFTADLMLGRHREVITELNVVLSDVEPARERLFALLMLALYQSGRQAEALDVYRHAQAAIVDGSGVLPSRVLRRLEQDILTHSPALNSPAAVTGYPMGFLEVR
ncbi:AfsR/SARP family transcriptional regulator [Streptomyces sp. NPDC001222]|uniref:AfsR/SARP family transcriptional regulator n=1 Tax=Streptomyces sp. NPDC001222 TaxID=3364548 RepID=UPI0036857B17